MLNTSLIDVSTGQCAYEIVTIPLPPSPKVEADGDDSSIQDTTQERRHTSITDPSGKTLVSITWNGRRPDIIIMDEKIGGLPDLFGSTTVRFMPKILAIPTRFDTEYIWTATPDSLTLFDYDSESTKGTFYQNVIRVSTSFKPRKSLVSSTSSRGSTSSHSLFSFPSSLSLSSSALASSPGSSNSSICTSQSTVPSTTHTKTPKSAFIPTHLPGVGSNYLEFCQHPLAHDVEIIVSFLMMEILRRGRFLLTPYTFEKPKMWQLKETRDLVLRRLRRNTV